MTNEGCEPFCLFIFHPRFWSMSNSSRLFHLRHGQVWITVLKAGTLPRHQNLRYIQWMSLLVLKHRVFGYPHFRQLSLVGGIPTSLKNMSSSVGMIIPNIWKNKKCSKPPTSSFQDLRTTYHMFQHPLKLELFDPDLECASNNIP